MAKGKKKKVAPGDVASNRYASYKYDLQDKVECGIVLFGTEVKSLRNGGATLKEGYALIRDDEVYLVSVHIPPYAPGVAQQPRPRPRPQAPAQPPPDRQAQGSRRRRRA